MREQKNRGVDKQGWVFSREKLESGGRKGREKRVWKNYMLFFLYKGGWKKTEMPLM
ncbi:hypothetical protein HanRHA438_Chr02g0062291 [Helianthus annuus]|nr:hypothetical protein HanRHA438_Chr02g0062291 [Helianthus annuus]